VSDVSTPLVAVLLHGAPSGDASAALPVSTVVAIVVLVFGVGILLFWYYERRLAASET